MNLLFDLRYAWRLLKKSWGYSLMCAAVVALSVGLAVWTYALAYSQSLKPLPFPGSERWFSVQIAPDATSRSRANVDAYTWQEMLGHSRSADFLGAFSAGTAVLSEGQATTSLRGGSISPRLLAGTAVVPVLGRTFEEADALPGATAVAILSFDTWQRYFAADPAVIGRSARIDAAPVQIVGVLPKDFFAFQDFEVWLPLRMPHLARPQDSTLTLSPLMVERENQNRDAIVSELKSAVEGVNRDYPEIFNRGRHVALIPASRMYTHGVTAIVAMMSLIAFGVLLIGCVNISMVFLARLLERSRELALRTALGASRPRLLRQCLLETALVVLLGLVAGYGLAALGIEWTHGIDAFGARILADGRSGNLPALRPFDLVVAVVSAAMIWLLSTVIPAWRIARQDAASVLAGSGKGSTVSGSNKTVAMLVGMQVVISCVVLVTCGNVVMSVNKELNMPSGLNTSRVLMSTYPTAFDGRFQEPATRLRYWEVLAETIATKLPGSEVAFTTAAPTRPARVAATIETRQGGENQGALTLPLTVVSENYFKLMGVSLRSGRLFESTDNPGSLKVAIVDEKMAARFWPDQEVLGKRIRLNSSEDRSWLTIVGVVANVRGAPYRPDADIGSLYQPLRQTVPGTFQVLIRLPRSGSESRVAIRAAAFQVDRDLPLHNLQSLDDYLAAMSLGNSAMAEAFSGIALVTALLAASGLFGLISRSVAQRTQEVGIRRALGATPWRATSMFRSKGALYLSVAVAGVAVGIMLTPLLSKSIPNIFDRVIPVTLAVVLLMSGIIFTASYLPTRRAVALEPGDALRYE